MAELGETPGSLIAQADMSHFASCHCSAQSIHLLLYRNGIVRVVWFEVNFSKHGYIPNHSNMADQRQADEYKQALLDSSLETQFSTHLSISGHSAGELQNKMYGCMCMCYSSVIAHDFCYVTHMSSWYAPLT